MKKSHPPLRFLPFIIFLCVLPILGGTASAKAASIRLAILPFDMHAKEDLKFLEDGITELFTSRLASEGRVEVVNQSETLKAAQSVKGFKGESRALLAGGRLKADYVLWGSITVVDNTVRIEAQMVDVSGDKAPLPFSAQAEKIDEVIPKINQFATQIQKNVFDGIPSETNAPPPPRQDADKNGPLPNEAFNKKAAALNPIRTDDNFAFWKSPDYKLLFNDIAVGDVNGDGLNEVIIASEKTFLIYQMTNGALKELTKITPKNIAHILAVSVADINQNNIPEIFISGLNTNRNQARSNVYEFSKQTCEPIAEDIAYYINAIAASDGKNRLFAQKQLTGDSDVDDSPIVEMIFKNGTYGESSQILAQNKSNVFSLAYGQLSPHSPAMMFAFDRSEKIVSFDQSGSLKWKGSSQYGGNQTYFLSAVDDPLEMENRKYYPLCLKMADLDNDGKKEIIAAKNFGFPKKYRKLTDWKLEILAWNGLGLTLKWETAKSTGHIRGFDLGDMDNDGELELAAVVVLKDGASILSRPQSVIIAYDIKTN